MSPPARLPPLTPCLPRATLPTHLNAATFTMGICASTVKGWKDEAENDEEVVGAPQEQAQQQHHQQAGFLVPAKREQSVGSQMMFFR